MSVRRVLAVTGTRAEFGLLRPVLDAIDDDPRLALDVIVTGTHHLPPAHTAREVTDAFPGAVAITMQRDGEAGRCADAAALGRGVDGIAAHLGAGGSVDVVLVLGDRIEAFAAAAAAAVAGVRVAHLHGGDVAEGVADDALRHAITKLAHLHLPATPGAAARIERLGERPETIHVVGSPAMDGLERMTSLDDATFAELGAPDIVLLLHPVGDDERVERARAELLVDACRARGRVLALHPNHDAGRAGIMAALEAAGVPVRAHLERSAFIGLLRRVRLIAGNSSAALIEASALDTRAVDVGSRQAGRERGSHVVSCADWAAPALARALGAALDARPSPVSHPFGPGDSGPRTAEVLATLEESRHPVRKRIAY